MNEIILGTVRNKCGAQRSREAAQFLRKKCPKQPVGMSVVARLPDETPQQALLRALANREIDAAAVELPAFYARSAAWRDCLSVGAVLMRGDVRSVLITRKKSGVYLPNAVVLTGGAAAAFQLPELYADIRCLPAPGGIHTNFGDLIEQRCDGLLLPAEDVKRLQYHRVRGLKYQYLDPARLVPVAGQAVTALIVRTEDDLLPVFQEVSDIRTLKAVEIEQELSGRLPAALCAEAGPCVYARIDRARVTLSAYVRASGKGFRVTGQGEYGKHTRLVAQVLQKILNIVEYS